MFAQSRDTFDMCFEVCGDRGRHKLKNAGAEFPRFCDTEHETPFSVCTSWYKREDWSYYNEG